MATQLDVAEAQLTGYSHGRAEYSIESLVDSMGLTKKEWIKIKERHLHGLTENEVWYLDNHFKQ